MAGVAHSLADRSVDDPLVVFPFVAMVAKLKLRFFQLVHLFGLMGIMTVQAFSLGHGRVKFLFGVFGLVAALAEIADGFAFNQGGAGGLVRVVAGGAPHLQGGVDGFLVFLALMAGVTELRKGISLEEVRAGCLVGVMAGGAPHVQGHVDGFLVFLAFVTRVAEFFSFRRVGKLVGFRVSLVA